MRIPDKYAESINSRNTLPNGNEFEKLVSPRKYCLFVDVLLTLEVDKRDEKNIGKVSYASSLNEAYDVPRDLGDVTKTDEEACVVHY